MMETMPRYKDPSLPVEQRVEDLLARMTLEEKAAQLCGDLPRPISGTARWTPRRCASASPTGTAGSPSIPSPV